MKRTLVYFLAVLLLFAVMPLSLFGCEKPEDAESSIASSEEESIPVIIIKDDPNYQNVALNKAYKTSGLHPDDANPSYPDEGNATFTDGVRPADTASYSDKTFAGFNKTSKSYVDLGYSAVTVDLGGLYYVDRFVANFASSYHISVGIGAPEFVFVYLSNDGKEFSSVGVIEVADKDSASAMDATLALDSARTARFVEFRFVGGSNWIMVSEVEAFGIPAEEEIPLPPQEEAVNILFIGNSSTYFYNIPHKLQAICREKGLDIEVEYCCIGGAYLSEYADASNQRHGTLLRSKLAGKKYDYVVVQDNSNADYEESKPAMDVIVPLIKENGAELLIYKRYSSNDDPTQRLGSATRHHNNYTKLANDFNVDRVAAGADAFLIATETHPEINLYHTDNSHHGNAGAYLLASTMAIEFFDLDIADLTYTAGVDADTAQTLREIALKACTEGYDYE